MIRLLFRSNGETVGEQFPAMGIVPRKNETILLKSGEYTVRDVTHDYRSVYIIIDVIPAFTGNQL